MPVRRFLAASTLLLVSAACGSDSTAPDRAIAAGTYTLTVVDPRGAASGTMTLAASGQAERRVRYASRAGVTLSQDYVARGTFELQDGGVVLFALHEEDGRSPYLWDPRARLAGRVLELQYPDALDGPPIVERYERQE